MWEKVQEGFDVFLTEGGKSFGAVRQLRKHELVIYVENAGDFDVPFAAVKDAGAGKVVLDDIISHILPLSEASRAYELFKNKEDDCTKVVLKP